MRDQNEDMEFVNRLHILLSQIQIPLIEWCAGQILYATSLPIPDSDMAARLNVSRSELSKYMQDAEQMGILMRIPGQGIVLTAGGRRQFGEMLRQSFAIIRGEQAGFSPEMAQSFFETQKKSGISSKQGTTLRDFTDIRFPPLSELV